MEAIAYEVNVTTGEAVERPRTADELAAEAAEQIIWAERSAAEKTADEKKTAILSALADATGYTPDELKEALNA